jgi:two-component system, chemotaxis family, chemotaxis protein CheY
VEAKPFAPRVLVVDDERPIREVLTEALRECGYEVQMAANGAEALQRLEHWRPDVVILDLMMPVLDAGGFLRALRLHPGLAEVPTIILTAAYEAHEHARRLGATVCLTKPFKLEELLEAVDKAAAVLS